MAKPLYLQYQQMKGPVDWPDFQVLTEWARGQGFNGTQAVVRENANHPWGPDNCKLKADGARPKVAEKGGSKKGKGKAKAKAEVEAEAEVESSDPTAEDIAGLLAES